MPYEYLRGEGCERSSRGRRFGFYFVQDQGRTIISGLTLLYIFCILVTVFKSILWEPRWRCPSPATLRVQKLKLRFLQKHQAKAPNPSCSDRDAIKGERFLDEALNMGHSRTLYQDAIRLLFILVHGSKLLPPKDDFNAAIFRGKTRLHAMDFWVRYPDYLAFEMISLYKSGGQEGLLSEAERIFECNEPDLRRIPMIRYKFGAFERIDDALSPLVSKGLLRISGKKRGQDISEVDYLISQRTLRLVQEIPRDFPELEWYEQRARLVVEISGNRKGRVLKERQYEHMAYAGTKLGGIIPSIAEEVKRHIEELKRAA